MRLLIMAAFAAALITSASAEPMGAPSMGANLGLPQTDQSLHGGNPLNLHWDRYSPTGQKLRALHDEGVKMQEADGGKLTDEHRAYLQAKLDAIIAEARKQQ